MVISRRSEPAARPAASLRMEMITSVVKAAPLPRTANSQMGPELSAREASTSPVTNNTGLTYLLSFMVFLVSFILLNMTFQMLASTADKNCGRNPGPSSTPPQSRLCDKAGGR